MPEQSPTHRPGGQVLRKHESPEMFHWHARIHTHICTYVLSYSPWNKTLHSAQFHVPWSLWDLSQQRTCPEDRAGGPAWALLFEASSAPAQPGKVAMHREVGKGLKEWHAGAGQQEGLKGPETRGINNMCEMVTKKSCWNADMGLWVEKGLTKVPCPQQGEAQQVGALWLHWGWWTLSRSHPNGGEQTNVTKLRPLPFGVPVLLQASVTP